MRALPQMSFRIEASMTTQTFNLALVEENVLPMPTLIASRVCTGVWNCSL
jgi:hypothetical protein